MQAIYNILAVICLIILSIVAIGILIGLIYVVVDTITEAVITHKNKKKKDTDIPFHPLPITEHKCKSIIKIEADKLIVCKTITDPSQLYDFINNHKGYYFAVNLLDDTYEENKLFRIGYYACNIDKIVWVKSTIEDFRKKYFR